MATVEITDRDIRYMMDMLGPTENNERPHFDMKYRDTHNEPFPSDVFFRVCRAAKDSIVVNLPITKRDLIDLAQGDLSEDGLERVMKSANRLLDEEQSQ